VAVAPIVIVTVRYIVTGYLSRLLRLAQRLGSPASSSVAHALCDMRGVWSRREDRHAGASLRASSASLEL